MQNPLIHLSSLRKKVQLPPTYLKVFASALNLSLNYNFQVRLRGPFSEVSCLTQGQLPLLLSLKLHASVDLIFLTCIRELERALP